jgi:hypothetical protein
MLRLKMIRRLFLLQFSQNYDAKAFNVLARPGEFWRGSFLSWARRFLLYLPKEFNPNPVNAAIVHCAALLIDCGRLTYGVKTAEKARGVMRIAELLKFHGGFFLSLSSEYLSSSITTISVVSWKQTSHVSLAL